MIYIGFATMVILAALFLIYGGGMLETLIEFPDEDFIEWVIGLAIFGIGLALAFYAAYAAPFPYNLKTLIEHCK